jgi:DNA-directed RNA polymerase subunit RPC12/RpoP
MKKPNEISCPKCGSRDVDLEITPDKIHYGRYVCNPCGRFIQWAKKPKRVKAVSGGLCRFRGSLPPRIFILTDETGNRLGSVDLSLHELKPGEPLKVDWTVIMG